MLLTLSDFDSFKDLMLAYKSVCLSVLGGSLRRLGHVR